MNAEEGDTVQMQVVSVPGEKHMLCPGEVRQVELDYFLFHSILNTGSTLFGCVNYKEWAKSVDVRTRGTILSILSVKNVVQDAITDMGPEDAAAPPPRIAVECRCSGRFDVLRLMEKIPEDESGEALPWNVVQAECVPVVDWEVWDIADRRKLAAIEWNVWQSCREVASLLRKLRQPEENAPFVVQELSVWAPAEYDREISEDEWAKTPLVTRGVWCQRAESFSFGILRCMESDADAMREARNTTNTIERLDMAIQSIERKRAKTRAQLSLKNALN